MYGQKPTGSQPTVRGRNNHMARMSWFLRFINPPYTAFMVYIGRPRTSHMLVGLGLLPRLLFLYIFVDIYSSCLISVILSANSLLVDMTN